VRNKKPLEVELQSKCTLGKVRAEAEALTVYVIHVRNDGPGTSGSDRVVKDGRQGIRGLS